MDAVWLIFLAMFGIGVTMLTARFFKWPYKLGKKKNLKAFAGAVMIVIALFGLGVITKDQISGALDNVLSGAGETDLTGEVVKVSCPDTGLTTLQVLLEDDDAATTTYVASSTVNVYDKDGKLIANNTTASSGFKNIDDLTCGTKVSVCVLTQAGVAGAVCKDVTLSGPQTKVDFHTNQLSYMQIRIKDTNADSWQYLFPGDVATGANGTTAQTLNKTRVYSSVAAADLSVSTGETLNLEIELKSATANKFYDDKAFPTIVSIDVGSDNEFEVNDIVISENGVGLSDAEGLVNDDDDDYSFLSDADAYYKLDAGLSRSIRTIDLEVPAKSGSDPDTSNDDVTVCLWNQGLFQSSVDGKIAKTGFVTDASTPVPVGPSTKYLPCFIVQMS